MVFCEEPFGDGLVEHYVDIVGVTGSIPVPPTITPLIYIDNTDPMRKLLWLGLFRVTAMSPPDAI